MLFETPASSVVLVDVLVIVVDVMATMSDSSVFNISVIVLVIVTIVVSDIST